MAKGQHIKELVDRGLTEPFLPFTYPGGRVPSGRAGGCSCTLCLDADFSVPEKYNKCGVICKI